MKSSAVVSEINPTGKFSSSRLAAAASRYQKTLAQVSVAANPLQRRSSVINSDSTQREAGSAAFVLRAAVWSRYSNPLNLKALRLPKPDSANETDH